MPLGVLRLRVSRRLLSTKIGVVPGMAAQEFLIDSLHEYEKLELELSDLE